MSPTIAAPLKALGHSTAVSRPLLVGRRCAALLCLSFLFVFRLTGVEQVECLLNFLLLLLRELCSLRATARRRRLGAGRLLEGRHLKGCEREGGGCWSAAAAGGRDGCCGCGSRVWLEDARSDECARVASLACECGGCRWVVVGSETANGEQKKKKKSRQTEPFGGFKGQFAQMNKIMDEWNLIMRRHLLHFTVQPIRR